MESVSAMEMESKASVIDRQKSVEDRSEGTCTTIYIDPEKERAALRKFDMFVLPVSVVFLVLSSLDRNNVSEVLVPPNPP